MCEARKRLRTWVEGVTCACAVTGRVLLGAATHLTWGVASELDDMEGIEDAGRVLELIVDGVLAVPGRDPSALKAPEPCRDPNPGRVNHLHHHTPVALSNSPRNQGTPPADCTTQHRAPEYLGCEPRSSDGSPPNRRADHTDHNDQATHSSSS